MKARLLVGRTDEDCLCVLVGVEGGSGVELEALGNLVVELDLVAERVKGGPGLSDSQAMGLVGVLGLDITSDVRRLRVTDTVDLEGDVRGGRGLNLEGGTVEVVVLAEEIIGGLANVLYARYRFASGINKPPPPGSTKKRQTNLPGWGNGLGQRHCAVMEKWNEGGVYALAAAGKKWTNRVSLFGRSAVGKCESQPQLVRTGEQSQTLSLGSTAPLHGCP